MKLNDKSWKPFVLNEIFTIKATKSGIDRNKLNGSDGNIPYLTRTDKNNAWDSFIGEQPKYGIDEGNVISVGLDTQTAFYQPIPFYTGQNIQVFSHEKMNKHIALFITPLLRQVMQKFNWGGNGATLGRLRRQKIMLPVTESGQPDYEFMEAYMKAVEKRLLTQYKAYLTSVHGSDLNGGGKIRETRWKAFFIEEVCDIFSGQDIYKLERIPGNTPYITATAEQNGIGYFVGNNNDTLERDCISVNRNGSVGYAFYHPYLALYGNDTRKLSPKFRKGNKYVSIFLAMSITAQKDKYGYGLKMGTGRLKRQKIILPATADGQPDYDYMESYMRKKEAELLLQYISFRLTA